MGLLGVWNLADSDLVKCTISPHDIADIEWDDFIIYEYFSKKTWKVTKHDVINVELPRMGYKLFFILPAKHNAVAIGLINKYNSPATIISQKIEKGVIKVTVADSGIFGTVIPKKPKSVFCNGKKIDLNYENGLLTIEIAEGKIRQNNEIEIKW